ncbi:MAG: Xaa-Pro aminopeptidase [Pseudomonadales bacterium]|nr:Xaa-Pro aminopeptidase [Pseudomonadales bacterium]
MTSAVPAISTDYAQRRRKLMELMGENSIAILPAAEPAMRNGGTEYAYRQNSDLLYLTGFLEPHSVLVLMPGREHGEMVLFCQDRDPSMELWTGYRAGPEGACKTYGADDAFPIDDVDDILPGLLEGRAKVFYAMGCNQNFDLQLMEWIKQIRSKARSGIYPPHEFVTVDHVLHELRLLKSKEEQSTMKQAGKISAQAHVRAMQICKPGMMEYELEAELLHEFVRNGARAPAYSSIVGGGANGCILHYIENNAELLNGDLVLIDAGCELDGYAADITRTFPINGRFSEAQAALYEIVLDAQQAAFDVIVPGSHWNQPHEATVRVITEGLLKLGLLEGDLEQLIEQEGYRDFYMHKAGHWLGMDVHDVGDYKIGGEWRVLEPGMVLTVEPGIYVSPHNTDVDEKWRGIGIRIEDDVIVTRTGCDVMSDGVPKTIQQIEQLMAG